MISKFGYVLLFIIGSFLFVIVAMLVARMIRPFRPNEEKLTTYECGEEPIGNSWGQFNIRFHIIALIFILFEVEIIFLFPWAIVFSSKILIEKTKGLWGWFSLVEVILFVVILALGLVYTWRKGLIEWIKPIPKPTNFMSKVPKKYYEKINSTYSLKK
ncbi:MAG: NADH-quinone oxidoreductase subunit A [Flammeovirgaceae bacterium]